MEEVSFFGGLIAAFAFGTIWFYFASVFCFFAIMALSENDHELISIAVLVGFVFLMEKSGAFNIFAEPWVLLKWLGLYFVIGVAWSFAKWFSFMTRKAEDYVDYRMEYLKRVHRQDKQNGENKLRNINSRNVMTEDEEPTLEFPALKVVTEKTEVPDDVKADFRKYLRENGFLPRYLDDDQSIIPSALNYKSKITTWIVWWPTSALWTLMSDPMVRIANWIFSRLKGTYQLIANKAFSKFEEI